MKMGESAVNSHYDVAVIGGGVIGSAVAYYLAKRGVKAVLLDKQRLAGEASCAAAGMLAAQAESDRTGPLFDLLRRSRAMFPALAEELREISGIDIGLVRSGLMKIAATAEQEDELRRIIADQLQAGERAEWLAGDDVRRREPGLAAAVRGAAFFPDDAQVSAPELAAAFAHAAAALGAHIREFAEVKKLLLEQDHVIGVMTQEETIHCDRVVIASGVWSGSLPASAGAQCPPLYPVKGECFSILTHTPLIQTTVVSEGCYIVPKRGWRLVVGATAIPGSYDRKVSFAGIHLLMSRAQSLLPGIAAAEWERAWSGLRPQTPDGLPYLGEHPELKGVYMAAGHYRNGILLSPITGELAARWACGQGDDADRAFRVDRMITSMKVSERT